MRVEASSMLMISSATRQLESSVSARAMSIRCSCPPLSWWGYLPRIWPGVEADRVQRRLDPLLPLRAPQAREVLGLEHREHAIDLEDRVAAR